MKLPFYKYEGTGNDFVMIDNRHQLLSKNDTKIIKKLCDRKFGIGADGLILLENPENTTLDFKMVYFNADGEEGSMCGNGGRCILAFANYLGIIKERAAFSAIDGIHEGSIKKPELVGLKMTNVSGLQKEDAFVFLDTGSPHHIIFAEKIEEINIKKDGTAIRYSDEYKNIGGTNVNFVEPKEEGFFKLRTFERGVEDETLSCGTGATAVALAAFATGRTESKSVSLETMGGSLKVTFDSNGDNFTNIWLIGPAKLVFKGEILC